ncbi:MAG: hypothetical protein RJA98_2632 [Pseudomonadota bacterium]|jgi:hypothetical protein
MTRKRTKRRVITPLPPRGLRPKLDRGQIRDLALAHIGNLDAIAKGSADEQLLWDVAGQTLTWSRVAERLGAGMPEMHEQLLLCARLVERYGRTGRVVFTGEDYQLAKDGLSVMDQLAELVDLPTAIEAADWSEAQTNALAASCTGGRLTTHMLERLAA